MQWNEKKRKTRRETKEKEEETKIQAEKSKSWPPQILNSIFHSPIFRSKIRHKNVLHGVNYDHTKFDVLRLQQQQQQEELWIEWIKNLKVLWTGIGLIPGTTIIEKASTEIDVKKWWLEKMQKNARIQSILMVEKLFDSNSIHILIRQQCTEPSSHALCWTISKQPRHLENIQRRDSKCIQFWIWFFFFSLTSTKTLRRALDRLRSPIQQCEYGLELYARYILSAYWISCNAFERGREMENRDV